MAKKKKRKRKFNPSNLIFLSLFIITLGIEVFFCQESNVYFGPWYMYFPLPIIVSMFGGLLIIVIFELDDSIKNVPPKNTVKYNNVQNRTKNSGPVMDDRTKKKVQKLKRRLEELEQEEERVLYFYRHHIGKTIKEQSQLNREFEYEMLCIAAERGMIENELMKLTGR